MCLGLEYILESYNFFFLHSFSWELHMLWPEKRDSTENRISTKRFRDSEKLKIFIRFNQKPEKNIFLRRIRISLSPSTCMHLLVEKELWRVCTSYHAANQTNVLSGQIAYNQSK